MKRRLRQGVYLRPLLSRRVVRPISKFYDTAMNIQRVAGRGIRAGLLSSAALALAFVACSSRPSQASGPLALQPPIADPLIKVIADEATPGISFLSWDTEGGEKAATNLLRAGSAVRVQFLADGAWNDAKMVDRRPGSGGDVSIYGLEAGTARLDTRATSPTASASCRRCYCERNPSG